MYLTEAHAVFKLVDLVIHYIYTLHTWHSNEPYCVVSVDVAKAVLDRCMVDNVTREDKNIMNTEKYKVEFNYEFLDDYRDVPWKERWRKRVPCCFSKESEEDGELIKNYAFSDVTSTVDAIGTEHATNQPFVAAWGPSGFSPLAHPLQLMVRDTQK